MEIHYLVAILGSTILGPLMMRFDPTLEILCHLADREAGRPVEYWWLVA